VGAGAELHVLSAKRRDFAVPKTRLNCDEQKRLIPPSDPRARIRSYNEGGGLLFCQKLYGSAFVTLRGDCKDALALQSKRWFTDGYVLKEGVYRGQSIVSCPCAVATVEFEVFEELPQEGSIEVFHAQFGRRPFEALGSELEQQAEGIPVGSNGVLACTELR
jgi:hypothetical protein